MQTHAVPRKIKKSVGAFFRATQAKCLFVSACNFSSSGCHDCCKLLKQQFPASDYAAVSFDFDRATMQPSVHFKIDGNLTKSDFETVCVTGCMMGYTDLIITKLNIEHGIKKLKHCYLITAIHQEIGRHDSRIQLLRDKILPSLFNIRVDILTQGVEHKSIDNIGMPCLVSSVLPDAKCETNCFGLIFAKVFFYELSCSQAEKAYTFLKEYFKQIQLIVKNKGKQNAVVVLINDPVYEIPSQIISRLNRLAAQYNIKLCIKERMPQVQFFSLLKSIASLNGMIMTDGTMTLLQSIYLGATPFFYCVSSNPSNKLFAEQLVGVVPHAFHSFAKKVLGLSQDCSVTDMKPWEQIGALLKSEVQESNTKFVELQKTYCSPQKEQKVEQVVIQAQQAMFNKAVTFGDKVCEQLGRIAGFAWFYKESKNIAVSSINLISSEPSAAEVYLKNKNLKVFLANEDGQSKLCVDLTTIDINLLRLCPAMPQSASRCEHA